jgi:hypothetical protein
LIQIWWSLAIRDLRFAIGDSRLVNTAQFTKSPITNHKSQIRNHTWSSI